MAEYGRVGQASDYMRDEVRTAVPSSHPTRRVQKKLVKTTVYDFGDGPYNVADFKDFYEQIKDLPEGAKIKINHGDSQMDGEFLTITVTEGA
jgi:hypothetical protein